MQVEESMLAVMFSDRWAGSHKRDDNGRIFLNYNPHCFDKILRCLRSKAIEHQHQPMVPSSIDTEHKADYFSLLAHLGLLECMGYYAEESMHFSEGICVNLVGDIKTVEAPPSPEGACTAAPEMLADQVHFFKCAVLTDAWVFLGVNQAARLQCDNRIHTTSYGWSTFSQYQAGKRTTTGTTHWRQGDAVLFKLDLIGYTMSMCSPSHPNPISIPMVRNDRNGFVFFVSFSAPGRSGQEAQQVQLLKVLPEDFGRFD